MGLFFVALLVGVALAIVFAATRPPRLRQILLIGIAVVANLGALFALAPAYLVSRLDGSSPPTLAEFLAPYSLQILLVLIINVVIIYLYPRRQG